jgi:cysteine desulfurase
MTVMMTGGAATPVYLDCAATTPLDPRVGAEMRRFFEAEFGNAGSRTHEWGMRARTAVERARDQVAAVVGVSRGDVVFTSGAAESNNLAILGLMNAAGEDGSVVATAIEHRAVLEPLQALERRGVRLTLVPPEPSGVIDAARLLDAVTDDTRLVSVMHVNNETGAIQPIDAIADGLASASAGFSRRRMPTAGSAAHAVSCHRWRRRALCSRPSQPWRRRRS